MIEKLKEEVKRLISIPSHRNFLPILEYIEERLFFIPFEKQEVPGKGYNLIYKNSPFMVNTHVDTVPPIDMKNPFSPIENNCSIYGRGAADTKGLIASLIIALEKFREENPDKEVPVSISFTVDEEQNTALGSGYLLNRLEGINSILVLEPTYGKICSKQMGTLEFSLNVSVPSFHASEFEKGENPVKMGMYAVEKIEKLLNRPVNIIEFKSGWKLYATPKSASILCEVKIFEKEDYREVQTKIKDLLDSYFKGKVSFTLEDAENFIVFKKKDMFPLIKKAYTEALGKKPVEGVMPSWTDAANFHKAGKECVVFGFGNLADSHTNREHITFEELENNFKVLYRLLSILSH